MATKKSKKKKTGPTLQPATKPKARKTSVRIRRDPGLIAACVPYRDCAQKIIARCEALHPSTKTDCKGFLNAVATEFFGAGFVGNADAIVAFLRDPRNGWSRTRKRAEAIAQAKAAMFVIAGATSNEMGKANGHVAVVVDLPLEMKDTPMAFAGSIDSEALRIPGRKISSTFNATMVHSEQLDYFYKEPTRP